MTPSLRARLRFSIPLLLGLCSVQSARAQQFDTLDVRNVARTQVIAPGETGDISFSVTETGTQPVAADVYGHFDADPASLTEYTFTPENAQRCQPPDLVPSAPGYTEIRFRAGPIANETLTCRYRITRAANSRNDLKFALCGSPQALCGDPIFFRGTLPHMSIQAEVLGQLQPGSADALVRLSVRNESARAVTSRAVTTGCWEFGGGIFERPPFEFETNFAGACAPSINSEICVSSGGQNYSSRAFEIGAIAPMSTQSCLVRIRFRVPLSQPVTMPIHFPDDIVPFVDGGIGFDPNAQSSQAVIIAGIPSAVPTLGGLSALVLVVLVLTSGLVARRRRAATATR